MCGVLSLADRDYRVISVVDDLSSLQHVKVGVALARSVRVCRVSVPAKHQPRYCSACLLFLVFLFRVTLVFLFRTSGKVDRRSSVFFLLTLVSQHRCPVGGLQHRHRLLLCS